MTRRSQHGSGQGGIRKDRWSGATERAWCLEPETSKRRHARRAEAQLRRDLGGMGDGGCATVCAGGSSLPLLGGYGAPSRDAGKALSGAAGPDGGKASGCRLRATLSGACAGTSEGDHTRFQGTGSRRCRPRSCGARCGDAVCVDGRRARHLRSHPRGPRPARDPARARADAGSPERMRRSKRNVARPARVGADRPPDDRVYFAGRMTSTQTRRWSEASINAVPGAPSTGQKTPAATTFRPADGST